MDHFTRAIALLSILAASLLFLSSAANASETPQSANYICVERDPVYVAGQVVVPSMRYCIPAP